MTSPVAPNRGETIDTAKVVAMAAGLDAPYDFTTGLHSNVGNEKSDTPSSATGEK